MAVRFRFKRFLDRLKAIGISLRKRLPKWNSRQLISYLKTGFWGLIALLAFLFITVTVRSVNSNQYLVRPLSVPLELERGGYSGPILAQHIIDQLNANLAESSSAKVDSTKVSVDSDIDLEFELMGLGLSAKSISHQIRKLFNVKVLEIRGEIIDLDAELRLVMRITDYPPFTLRLNYEQGDVLSSMDTLIDEASKRILYSIDPYRLAILEKNRGNIDRAEDLIRDIIKNRPYDQKWAYNLWGRIKDNQSQADLAEEYYLRAIALDPDFSPPRQNLGWLYFSQKRFRAANAQFQKGFEIDSKNFGVTNGLARSHLALGETEAAERAYQQQLADYPNNIWAYSNYSEFLLQYKRDTTAFLAFLETAKDQFVGNENAYVLTATVFRLPQLSNQDSVLYYAQRALELNPENINAHYLIRDILAEQKNYPALEERLRTILAILQSKNYEFGMQQDVYNFLAVAEYQQQKYDSAHVHAQKAIELYPANPYPWTTLAEIYGLQGMNDRFYESLEAALQRGFDVMEFIEEEPYRSYRSKPAFIELAQRYRIDQPDSGNSTELAVDGN